MSDKIEQVDTRRSTYFCISRERHAQAGQVVEEVPKEIVVFGRTIKGWLVTTESPLIDKVISINESLEEENKVRDSE